MRKRNYVNNKRLYEVICEYQEQCSNFKNLGKEKPPIPSYIGEAILLIANNLSNKSSFSGYSYKEEMVSDGIENCFHRDTKILTLDKGPIKISEVVGQKVIVKCRDGAWRPAMVKSYGKQTLYKYQFGSFNTKPSSLIQSVIATSNHRWFVKARINKRGMFEWKDEVVTDLRCGDMLQNVPDVDNTRCSEAVIHGIIFGDGSVEKKQQRTVDKLLCTQGREYPFIRVCKQDAVQHEIKQYFDDAGYKATYPPSANGDPVYYMGRDFFKKDLPFTLDPEYVAGFIYGWWLADGNKTVGLNRMQITTVNKKAIEWLKEYAAYGGYQVTGIYCHQKKERFENGQPLYQVTLAKNSKYKTRVRSIEYYGEDEVFCVEEPETNSFTLANGLLTGNCLLYLHNFDPEKTNNPFAYFTQIIKFAFIRRIEKEKKQHYIKIKNMGILFIENAGDDIFNGMQENFNNELTDEFVRTYENKLTAKKKLAKPVSNNIQQFFE